MKNNYPGTYELPVSDWTSPHSLVSASSSPRSIRASTCTTYVDTIVGVYYYVSGSPVGAYNDDRVDPVAVIYTTGS